MSSETECKCRHNKNVTNGGGSAVYGLGFLGALVYFFQNAKTIGDFVLGFVEALVWPGIVVYKLLESWKF